MFERFKLGFARQPTERDEEVPDPRYLAVSFSLPADACDAAKALVGKRFLATETPIFPIDGCDVASCSCGYRHYNDRREGPRRSLEIGISTQYRNGDERRNLTDRRDEGQRSDEELESETANYSVYVSTRE